MILKLREGARLARQTRGGGIVPTPPGRFPSFHLVETVNYPARLQQDKLKSPY